MARRSCERGTIDRRMGWTFDLGNPQLFSEVRFYGDMLPNSKVQCGEGDGTLAAFSQVRNCDREPRIWTFTTGNLNTGHKLHTATLLLTARS